MKKINAAIVGCGSIFSQHAEALMKLDSSNLVAVCDIDLKRAQIAGEKYNCKHYCDFGSLLKSEDFDVLHICTPHYLHTPMAIEAMQNGKHVLTEKPLAISSEAAEEMIRVSQQTGKKLGVCFQNRYNNTSKKVKELIASGKVGRIIGVKAFVTWHRDTSYYLESGWRGTWAKEGGGVLINQSIHTLDLLQWLIGDIEKIKGTAGTRLLEGIIEVEDTSEATIVFKNGATAIFYATNCYAANSPVEIEFVCERAKINLSGDLTVSYDNGTIETFKQSETKTGEKDYWGTSHGLLIEDFYRNLADGSEISIDGKQGINSIRMIEAIYKSSELSKFIYL